MGEQFKDCEDGQPGPEEGEEVGRGEEQEGMLLEQEPDGPCQSGRSKREVKGQSGRSKREPDRP
eukprot:1247629-Rhodomonas_salina.1